MQVIREERLTGERALFHSKDLSIEYSIFADGESPLKESSDISLRKTSFQWKYPLWYCKNIRVEDCDFAEMARAGIWYTDQISVKDTKGVPTGSWTDSGKRGSATCGGNPVALSGCCYE